MTSGRRGPWPRIFGPGRAHVWMFTGKIIDAAEAERTGLVLEVVPDEALVDRSSADRPGTRSADHV